LQDEPIEADDSITSSEICALLEQAVEGRDLEEEEPEGGDGEEEEGEEEADEAGSATQSVYAMTVHPRIQPAFQVEPLYDNGQDTATMCVPYLE
jgi:hypothetical protein